jgi:hypothetical protein
VTPKTGESALMRVTRSPLPRIGRSPEPSPSLLTGPGADQSEGLSRLALRIRGPQTLAGWGLRRRGSCLRRDGEVPRAGRYTQRTTNSARRALAPQRPFPCSRICSRTRRWRAGQNITKGRFRRTSRAYVTQIGTARHGCRKTHNPLVVGSIPTGPTENRAVFLCEFGTSVSLWLRHLCLTARPGFGSWATVASVPMSHQFHRS